MTNWNILAFDSTQDAFDVMERRGSGRYPMDEDVTYRVQGKIAVAGAGKSVNIGSGGIMFTTTTRLPLGRKVEVSVNWPALLDGSCPLKFVASGPVVRSDDASAVVRIERYEFRTRGARALLADSVEKLGPSAVLHPMARVR